MAGESIRHERDDECVRLQNSNLKRSDTSRELNVHVRITLKVHL